MDVNVKRQYDAWVHSPSVASNNQEELVLAFKISQVLGLPPTKTFKILRDIEGQREDWVQQVEALVASDSSLTFTQKPPTRLITLVDAPASETRREHPFLVR